MRTNRIYMCIRIFPRRNRICYIHKTHMIAVKFLNIDRQNNVNLKQVFSGNGENIPHITSEIIITL